MKTTQYTDSNFKTSNFTAKALMLSPKPKGDLTVATAIFDIQSVVANAVLNENLYYEGPTKHVSQLHYKI